METRIMVLYYSMYGNTYRMAREIFSGIEDEGCIPMIRRVPEILPPGVIASDGRIGRAMKDQEAVPVASPGELEKIDGLVVGSPTRFGNMSSQMRNFWDTTGGLWTRGVLVDKPAAVFCCTGTMHGGQESTLLSMMLTLIHHGMIIVGVPFSVRELAETVSGGTPYGPTAVVGPDSSRQPLETDLTIARELGKRIAVISRKLKSGR